MVKAIAIFSLLALALALAWVAALVVFFRKLAELLFRLLGELLAEPERQERT